MGNPESKASGGKTPSTPREPPKPEPVFMEYAEHGIIGRRPTMEDAHLLEAPWGDDNMAIFGVFDGHFGSKCSEYVAQKLPGVLKAHPKFNEDVQLALTESFLHVDKEFLRQAVAEKLGDGSTGIVTLIKNEKIYCANTGDSRGVLCEGGKTVALSEDHKPEVPRELERIEKAGGIILLGRVQGKLAVARSFGDLDFKNEQTLEARWITAEPDILEVPLTTDTEFILLACDGLWDKFSNEEAVDFVRKRIQTNVPTLKIAQEIVQEAYNLGSTDNITAVLVVFNHAIKNKSMRRAVAAGEVHAAPANQGQAHGHAENNTNSHVTQTPSKKKDKTPKKEPKGVTKTSGEPPQVIPPSKRGNKTTGDKPRTPRGDTTEASKPHNDEPSQSNTSDEKKTELASPKSDKSLSKESTDKSPRKHKDNKDKKKHHRDESKASSSNSSPAMNVSGKADPTSEEVKRSNGASDSIESTMEPAEIQEYRVQLAAIEGLLAGEPDNQELIGVRDQLRDIIKLASEVDTLQQPTTSMFDDDSDNEGDRVTSVVQAQTVSEPDQGHQNIPKNLINFEKKEELRYKDGRMVVEQNDIEKDYLDHDNSESYSSSDYSSSDSENEQEIIAKEYLDQIRANNTTNSTSEPVDGRFNQIANWEQYTKGIGSKLLAKYGYKKGQGVGRSKIGITEPISLDEQTGNSKAGLGHSKRHRHKRLPGDERPSKRARKSGQSDVSQAVGGSNYKPDYSNGENIFDYINKKTALQSPPKDKETIDLKKLKPEEVKKKHHELLKQLGEWKVQIDKFDMTYQRNLSRDPATAALAKKQRDEVFVQYEALSRQEKLLRTKIEMKKNRDKFKEF